jgi:tetrahydromethanopterin S-methyltransferase subunit G
MEEFIIRGVDSGNIQRSPTFQAIFNYTLSTTIDYPLQVTFDSAGIDVDNILKNKTPAIKKLNIVDAGLHYNLIKDNDKDITQQLIDKWIGRNEDEIPDAQKEIITNIYSLHKDRIHTIQMEFRNEALLEAGIPEEFLPGMRVPFRDHENLKLVLPVERKVVQKVEKYYQTLGKEVNRPEIILYGDIVDIDPLPDELKGGIKTARKQVEYFMSTRKKAMEEFLELCGDINRGKSV